MEKQKKITILSLAVLGVLYGAATASASPFLTLIHDLVAFASAKTPATAPTANNDLDHNAGNFSAVGLTFIPLMFISDSPVSLAEHAQNASSAMRVASLDEQPDSNQIGHGQGAYLSHSNGPVSVALGDLSGLPALSNPRDWTPDLLERFPLEPAAVLPTITKYADKRKKIAEESDTEGQPERDEKTKDGVSDPVTPLAKAPQESDQARMPKDREEPGKEGMPGHDEKIKDEKSDPIMPVVGAPREGDQRPIPNDGDKLAVPNPQALPNQNVLCDVNPTAYGCIDLIGDAYKPIFTVSAIHAVPEPGSLALLGLGIAGLGLIRRRRV